MQQLDPKAVWLFFVRYCFIWLLSIVFVGPFLTGFTMEIFGISKSDFNVFLILSAWILVPLIFWYIWARLTYYYYHYDLTPEGLKKESGIISKHYVTIMYERIQNVDIRRSLLDRFFGLSTLLIQTAGSSSVVTKYRLRWAAAEGVLPGLSKEIAEKLREELIVKSRQTKSGL